MVKKTLKKKKSEAPSLLYSSHYLVLLESCKVFSFSSEMFVAGHPSIAVKDMRFGIGLDLQS